MHFCCLLLKSSKAFSGSLRVYISTHKFDVIGVSNLKIAGYNLFRADHPSNAKQSGVCINLSFKSLHIHYFKEGINFEISLGGKICNFISLYHSPGKSSDTFEGFVDIFELTLFELTQTKARIQ